MRPNFKEARQHLTGNMPTGTYDMTQIECTVVTRKEPGIVYLTSFDAFDAWHEQQQRPTTDG